MHIRNDIPEESEIALHKCPLVSPGLEVVTIKTEGCVFTYRPLRCCEYDFLKNLPSPSGNLATLISFFWEP